MFSDTDYELALDIARGLNLPEEFGSDYDSDTIMGVDLNDQVAAMDIGYFFIETGATKAVIVPDDFNFVVKVSFTGFYQDDRFVPFEYAHAPDSTDYCWEEWITIHNANEEGFGAMFPETRFLGEFNGHRFYIQEKVKQNSRATSLATSQHSQDVAEDIYREVYCFDRDFIANIVENYGENYWEEFYDWANGYDDLLADMHGGNYGYTLSGKPIILDAATYRE